MALKHNKFTQYIILFLITVFAVHNSQAQGETQTLVLSGVIITGKKAEPVPGAHIYVYKAGRGTSSGRLGTFALTVVPGDSVAISSVGFKPHFYKIPYDKDENMSVVIELKEDVQMLDVVEVFPYPTEEIFKERILAMELPDEEAIQTLRRNLSQQFIAQMAFEMGMDAGANHKYYVNQYATNLGNRYMAPSLSLLNPFAWARFFQSLKRKKKKKN